MTDSLVTMSVGKKPNAKAKKARSKPTHPRTADMVTAAIKSLKDRSGSSLQAIKKYINTTYKVDAEKQSPFIKKYIKAAVESGGLVQTKGKGAAGSFKLSVNGEAAKRGAKTGQGKSTGRAKTPVKSTKTIRTPVKKTVKNSNPRAVKKVEAVKKVVKPLTGAEKKKTVKSPVAKPTKVKVKSTVKAVNKVKKSPVKAKAAKKVKKVTKKK